MPASGKNLGRVQKLIMDVLWDIGPCAAREITDRLNETHEIAHSTVQTLLRKMEHKGVVAHTEEGRTFLFHACVEADAIRRSATAEFVDRMFHGDPAQLVAYLLENENVPASELDRLRKLIREKRNQLNEGA